LLDGEVGKTYDKSDVKVMIKKVQTKKLEKAISKYRRQTH
jgi:hypothetical protein